MAGFQQLMKNLIVGEANIREDRFAVAVYGDTQSSTCMYILGHLPHQSSCVSVMFVKHSQVEKLEIRHD